jgi:hypothetical protein
MLDNRGVSATDLREEEFESRYEAAFAVGSAIARAPLLLGIPRTCATAHGHQRDRERRRCWWSVNSSRGAGVTASGVVRQRALDDPHAAAFRSRR